MKKFLSILLAFWISGAQATEVIRIFSPYIPAHAGHAAMVEIGADQILEISAFYPPVMARQPIAEYHQERIELLKTAIGRHRAEVQKFKKD